MCFLFSGFCRLNLLSGFLDHNCLTSEPRTGSDMSANYLPTSPVHQSRFRFKYSRRCGTSDPTVPKLLHVHTPACSSQGPGLVPTPNAQQSKTQCDQLCNPHASSKNWTKTNSTPMGSCSVGSVQSKITIQFHSFPCHFNMQEENVKGRSTKYSPATHQQDMRHDPVTDTVGRPGHPNSTLLRVQLAGHTSTTWIDMNVDKPPIPSSSYHFSLSRAALDIW